MFNLKGKRTKRPSSAKDRKQVKKLLLDLPQTNPTQPIAASQELGLKKQTAEPSYEVAKGESVLFSDADAVQCDLPSMGDPILEQQDVAIEKPAPIIKPGAEVVQEQSFLSKSDLIQISNQHVENEKLGDLSTVFGFSNELFWERLRREVKGAVRRQEVEEHLNFEAAPTPESERERQRKLPSYAGSSSSSGYLRF